MGTFWLKTLDKGSWNLTTKRLLVHFIYHQSLIQLLSSANQFFSFSYIFAVFSKQFSLFSLFILQLCSGVPYIAFTLSLPIYFVDEVSATPTPFSYFPSIVDGFFPEMSFYERLKNIFDQLIFSTSSFWKIAQLMIRWLTPWTDTQFRHGIYEVFSNNKRPLRGRKTI